MSDKTIAEALRLKGKTTQAEDGYVELRAFAQLKKRLKKAKPQPPREERCE